VHSNPRSFGSSASVWYSYVAPTTGTLIITSAGSSFNTLLGLYEDTAGTLGGLVQLAANDDCGASTTSCIAVSVTHGTTYAIQVDGFQWSSGAITLSMEVATNTPPTGFLQLALHEVWRLWSPITSLSCAVLSCA
jgi:hypothetical protein